MVERSWPNSTVVCLGTGPSLTAEDVESCRGKARVIAVNDAYRIAPWADALVACDASWWHRHQGAPGYTGPKWSIEHGTWDGYRDRWPDIVRLRNTGDDGIETDPTGLRTGRNSGALAIGLAVHYGASRIVLLGYDCGHSARGKSHFFGEHEGALRQPSPYHLFAEKFATMVDPLAALGITILNASRETRLTCFPRVSLAAALGDAAEAS